jgi:hypothetical protein
LVEKWIPPSRSKTTEIGQKIEGILGVKTSKLPKNIPSQFKLFILFFEFDS